MVEPGHQPWRPGDAVAALITTADGRYLLQHRDDIPNIFFPGYWGNFGGAIELDETPEQSLHREIHEELDFTIHDCTFFCTIGLDFRFAGIGEIVRHFFVVPVTTDDISTMRLHEGQGMMLVPGLEILTMAGVVPYDGVAIRQHLMRDAFRGRYVQSKAS